VTNSEQIGAGLTRRAMTLSLAGAAGATLLPWRARAAETWKAYTYNSVATVTASKGLQQVIDAVNAGTNGALTIRLNLGGTLQIAATNITQAVADNIVQFGDDSFFLGSMPIGGISRLPMFVRNMEEYNKVSDLVRPVLAEECKKKGVALLGKYVYPFQVFWSRKKLTSLADVSGQKLRVTSPEQAEFVKALGGVPITLGTAEVAAALDRGVVDGVTTAASGYGHIWKDLLKYCYRVNICFVDSLLIANERAWSKLSEDHRKVVVKAVDDITPKTTAAMAEEEQKYFDELAKGGMTITQPSAAEVAEAEAKIKPYWDQWAKERGADATALLAKAHTAIGR
jgi:TRAP-type C4-dicarboxylate transport system substrate-binding protein